MKTRYQIEKLLREYVVEIPSIQRDYAFGRREAKEKRELFVKTLFEKMSCSGIHLDFLYGKEINNRFILLDGQQRITTLWLIATYISKRRKEEAAWLNNFYYATRTSSREFCQALIENDWQPEDIDIDNHRLKVKWFYNSWKYDPTISGMIATLDTITRVFEDYSAVTLSDLNKVSFSFLDVEELGQPEELYLKMNSRGVALTPFENFKVALLSYCKENKWFDERELSEFSRKLDTVWVDVFWEYRSENFQIDEAYLAFIIRFLLNEWIIKTDKTAKEVEESKEYKVLSSQDFKVTFSAVKEVVTKKSLVKLGSVLDNLQNKKVSDFFPAFVKELEFSFIPNYHQSDINPITQVNRVIFLAISNYLSKSTIEEVAFKQWMRISWNIVNNADINSVSSMIGALKLINELSDHSDTIYDYLSGSFTLQSDFASNQVIEEIQKCRQIKKNPLYESLILEAESKKLFSGRLRDLIHIDDENQFVWEDFHVEHYEKLNSLTLSEDSQEIFRRSLLAFGLNNYPMNAGKIKNRPNTAPQEYLLLESPTSRDARSNWLKLISENKTKLKEYLKLSQNQINSLVDRFDQNSLYSPLIKYPILFHKKYMKSYKIFNKDFNSKVQLLIETDDRIQAYRYSNIETILLTEEVKTQYQDIENLNIWFWKGQNEHRQGNLVLDFGNKEQMTSFDIHYSDETNNYIIRMFQRKGESRDALELWNNKISDKFSEEDFKEDGYYKSYRSKEDVLDIIDKLIPVTH